MSGTSNPLGPMPMPGGEPVNMPGAPAPQIGAVGPGGPAPGGPPPGMPTSFGEARNILEAQHGRNKAAFEATNKALAGMDSLRQSLARLTEKGDVVTPEDVIEEAGKLVGRGLDPMALAGVLADMPQQGGGQALAGWLAQHAMAAAASEQQIKAQNNVARHAMGVSALHELMGHSIGQALMPQQGEPGFEPPNPLKVN